MDELLITVDEVFQEAMASPLAARASTVAASVSPLSLVTGRGTRCGAVTRNGASPSAGRDLLPPQATTRAATLLAVEKMLLAQEGMDFGVLVFLVCQLCEGELTALLVPTAEQVAPDLLRAISDSTGALRVLEAWAEKRVPVTLGVLQTLIFAQRRAVQANETSVVQGLSECFENGYLTLLRSRGPERAAAAVRGVRNAAAHARADPVTEDRYEEVVKLVTGAPTMITWVEQGPSPAYARKPDVALLHHHLALARRGRDSDAAA